MGGAVSGQNTALSSDLQRDRIHELKGTVTYENLASALARDAQASRLCTLFARVAEIEGYPEMARVLREITESQILFADGHIDFLRRVGDPITGAPIGETLQNLQSVISAELQDASEVLPRMVSTANGEGFPDIASWFESLAKAKQAHVGRVREALELLRGVMS
jgi:rubrerythrin